MYYRVAIQGDVPPSWQWKSTAISSLHSLLQFLRRFHDLPQDHLRIFSAHTYEEMSEQLVRENNGLGSNSVTAVQFLQERMLSSQQGTSTNMFAGLVLNGNSRTKAREKSAEGSLVSRQVKGEQTVNKVGFWNIMALVEA